MNELLKAIYDDFYNKPPAAQLKDEIEHSHQELIGRLDKADRRLVLFPSTASLPAFIWDGR